MESKKYVIEKLGAFGEGVAHDDGKVVFIKGALPGEVVLAQPELVKKSFTKAKLIKVLEPRPDRIKPLCKYIEECGGCSLQHLSYDAQLKLKVQTVKETLLKVGSIDVEIDKAVPSKNILRYRNKLSFPVRGKRVGMYAENSHNVVDIDDCLLQKEWNVELIKALRQFMKDFKLSGYNEKSGDIRHIVAREKNGSKCITLVTSEHIKVNGFIDYIPFDNYVLYQNVNSQNNNVILSDEFYLIGGKGVYPDFHPASFYQVNDDIEEALYADVLSECEGGNVVDAYCGAGNLTLMIASKANFVYGIEICKQAVYEAKERANNRKIWNAEFICGDCKTEFLTLSKKIKEKNNANQTDNGGEMSELLDKCKESDGVNADKEITVVFDPPRKGVDESTLVAALELAPQKIVYVSCNPATLARDLKTLLPAYTIQKINIYDMFPQTKHVETMIVLQRK